MLLAEGGTPTVWPTLRLDIAECGWTEEICPEASADQGNGRAWAIYPLPGSALPGPIPIHHRSDRDSGQRIISA